jgi:hypothetical protein
MISKAFLRWKNIFISTSFISLCLACHLPDKQNHRSSKLVPQKENAIYRYASERDSSDSVRLKMPNYPLRNERDLDILMQQIGNARVVLLGDATHGTAEFYY